MERVKGIGGIFLKSSAPPALRAWYADHLGVPVDSWGGAIFPWNRPKGMTVWSIHEATAEGYVPESQPVMVNFIVDDLDAMMAQLRAAGASVVDQVDDHEYGRFGWVFDPEGNKVELWQPPAE